MKFINVVKSHHRAVLKIRAELFCVSGHIHVSVRIMRQFCLIFAEKKHVKDNYIADQGADGKRPGIISQRSKKDNRNPMC